MLYEEMPRADYKRCKVCGRHADEVGPLSHQRLCSQHALERMRDNNLQIHAGSGPYYERRRYGIALREFGPRVALALKQAGFFDPPPVDATMKGA